MPSTIHIISGPPDAPRIERLVHVFRKACTQFKSALFLVPTRRLSDQVRESLGDCLSPGVYDLQAFVDELIRVHEPTLRPQGDSGRKLLIDRVLDELGSSGLPYYAEVAKTRGFAEAAAGYVVELGEAGVDSEQLLKLHPDGAKDDTRHRQAARILERYQRSLAGSRQFDPSDRLVRAAKLWEESKRHPFNQLRSVFVAGFTSLNHPQERLLDAIRETVEQFWIELPIGVGDAFAGPRAVESWLMRSPEQGLNRNREESVAAPTSRTSTTHLIKGAGNLGEVRLVARHVRRVLALGIRPERILIVARRFSPATIELFKEVFDEFDIPHDAECPESLARSPAVSFLLRAWQLPVDGWEFAPVASVLRSTYFRPDWPEVRDDPEIPAKAEALLRMLGETRGRDSFLRAAAAWENLPPESLEDEQPEEPLRQRKQRLARRCRPFLERFFRTWDDFELEKSAAATVAELKSLADEIGLSRSDTNDLADLALLWGELDRWAREEVTINGRETLTREQFARVLSAVGAAPSRARTARSCGVDLLSAERAVGLDCDYLFLVGLGEGSWPDLAAPVSLLDDAERRRLRRSGLALSDPEARLGREQLLFDTLIAAPRRELVLSYAAVDGKGQDLLPCSFLREYLDETPVKSSTQQRMLLDGYFEQEPMSEAELRTQCARSMKTASSPASEIVENLTRARTVARARFDTADFTAYDGKLRSSAVGTELANQVGTNRVFSPTALENYVACPFRFLLQHVLCLEPLEDPSEEVEYTRRGSAFHRALARFHERVKASVGDALDPVDRSDHVTDELVREISRAVSEYADRAPSRATAELWRLEGKRLERAARRYRDHWQSFLEPWRARDSAPAPHRFEASFGVAGERGAPPLVLTVGNVEVRIGGYIDRIDLVQLEEAVGFWVIDYKTGRATNYPASHIARFEKLQLPLYALAVERVLLKDRPARPLGLAYWLVTDTGAKPVLPAGRNSALAWVADAEAWPRFSRQLEDWVTRIVAHIRAGDYPLAPRSETCTDTCAFGSVCRIAQSRSTGKVFELELPLFDKGEGAE